MDINSKLLKLGVALLATVLGLGFTLGAATAASAQPAPDRLITERGGGVAILGSTAAQLRAQLGADYTVIDAGEVLVDLVGYEVQKDGVTQFYALTSPGPDVQSARLDLFIFVDPAWQTAEEIGPLSTIAEGEAAYGDATLSVSLIESREFARFENHPAARMFFRTRTDEPEAGIYPAGERSTMEYRDGAQIGTVWVSCVNDCPGLPVTGPEHVIALAGTGLVLLVTGLAVSTTARRKLLA